MSLTVVCEACSESHRVRDDTLGKKFKCKGCGKTLLVKPPDEPLDDLDDYIEEDADDDGDEFEAPPRTSKRSKSAGKKAKSSSGKSRKSSSVPLWKTQVPLGISCVYFGFVMMICVMLCGFGIVWSWSPRGDIRTLVFVLQCLMWLSVAANLITIVGKLLCLTAPPKMPGRVGIFIAVAIDLAAISISVTDHFSPLPQVLMNLNKLLPVIGFVCFVLFLHQLGKFLGESDVSDRATGVLSLGLGTIAYWLVLIFVVFAGWILLAGLLALGLLGLGVVGILRYAGLLNACRYALASSDR